MQLWALFKRCVTLYSTAMSAFFHKSMQELIFLSLEQDFFFPGHLIPCSTNTKAKQVVCMSPSAYPLPACNLHTHCKHHTFTTAGYSSARPTFKTQQTITTISSVGRQMTRNSRGEGQGTLLFCWGSERYFCLRSDWWPICVINERSAVLGRGVSGEVRRFSPCGVPVWLADSVLQATKAAEQGGFSSPIIGDILKCKPVEGALNWYSKDDTG